MSFDLIRSAGVATAAAGLLLLAEPAVPRAQPPAALETIHALAPTVHPPVAREAASLWLAPTAADRFTATTNAALQDLQAGVRLFEQGKYELALTRFVAANTPESPLRNYASYYAGISELKLERFEAARKRFAEISGSMGYLSQAVPLAEADAARGMKDYDAETKIYEQVLKGNPIDEPAIWLSLATASLAGGDRARSAEAYLHLYYEFPTNDLAEEAAGPVGSMPEVQPIEYGNTRYKLELGRAERLFGLRRIGDARPGFQRVQPHAKDDDAELVALRLAECDYFQSRFSQARDALKPYLEKGARQAEARFFYLMSQRGLKNNALFEQLTRALMSDFPDSTWAEDAFNNLVSYYIQDASDDQIAQIVREQYARYPRGRYAERAAWKAGWFAYRAGNMGDAAAFFESAAVSFPRSDYRPAYLYWAGRAREAMDDRTTAIARWQLETADYLNTYYGRLAVAALQRHGASPAPSNLVFVRDARPRDAEEDTFPPTSDLIRTLLALNLYDPALKELEYAQRMWGDSSIIEATISWISRQKAPAEKGTEQFNLARGSVTIMKRAYPQFLAAGGEGLPRELLTIIYPLEYWDLIKKYSAQRDLDPYLMAALMAQESTFVADIRSSANAYGISQLIPATARVYARKLNLRYSTKLLTNAEANINMGTAYFADLIRDLGAVHLALATYNAGPRAVKRWVSERPGLSREEFIDDIPYPETQNYVKRILGTADDYRRLYGPS